MSQKTTNFVFFRPSVIMEAMAGGSNNPAEGVAGGPYISVGDPAVWNSPSVLAVRDKYHPDPTNDRSPAQASDSPWQTIGLFDPRLDPGAAPDIDEGIQDVLARIEAAVDSMGEGQITPPETLRDDVIEAIDMIYDDHGSYMAVRQWLEGEGLPQMFFVSALADIAGSNHPSAHMALVFLDDLARVQNDMAMMDLTLLLNAKNMNVDTEQPDWRGKTMELLTVIAQLNAFDAHVSTMGTVDPEEAPIDFDQIRMQIINHADVEAFITLTEQFMMGYNDAYDVALNLLKDHLIALAQEDPDVLSDIAIHAVFFHREAYVEALWAFGIGEEAAAKMASARATEYAERGYPLAGVMLSFQNADNNGSNGEPD